MMTTISECSWQNYPPPTIEFCEARTCGLVAEPANAWSNLAYILVGLYLLSQTRKPEASNLWPGGLTAILVGICSFVFHAYPTFNTEYLDLFAMYLFGTYLLSINLYRAFDLTRNTAIGIYAAVIVFSATLLLLNNELGIVWL